VRDKIRGRWDPLLRELRRHSDKQVCAVSRLAFDTILSSNECAYQCIGYFLCIKYGRIGSTYWHRLQVISCWQPTSAIQKLHLRPKSMPLGVDGCIPCCRLEVNDRETTSSKVKVEHCTLSEISFGPYKGPSLKWPYQGPAPSNGLREPYKASCGLGSGHMV
jgi:hypothetical protein